MHRHVEQIQVVGDLSLIGAPLLGHVVAIKPGHAANCELAKLILQKRINYC